MFDTHSKLVQCCTPHVTDSKVKKVSGVVYKSTAIFLKEIDDIFQSL